jgi:hypothetical protein
VGLSHLLFGVALLRDQMNHPWQVNPHGGGMSLDHLVYVVDWPNLFEVDCF